jgi:phosphoribosyl 1,2-cyclic phosphodiesterase
MEVISLQSGSSGNSTYVASGDVQLLIDAGISGRKAEQRLAEHGKDIRDVDALIISHDHRDHTCAMGIFQRKFGLPIYTTRHTYDATRRNINLGAVTDVHFFAAGETLTFGQLSVETVRTPHDAADGVVFVIDDSRYRFGLLTDLGHVFPELEPVIRSLDAVMIESNYDESMLRRGPYPEFLQRRISGPAGHISNLDAARLLEQAASPNLQWACLAHLSDENNDPNLAIKTHQEILGGTFPLSCANRQTATEVMRLSDSYQPLTPPSRARVVQPLLKLQ